MKKSRRTYNGVHLNKKSNTQDVVEQSLTLIQDGSRYLRSNGILDNKTSMRKGFKMRDYSLFIFLNL